MDSARSFRIVVLGSVPTGEAAPSGEAAQIGEVSPSRERDTGSHCMARPRILIVDDDSNVRSAFHHWFTCRGFDADEAEDGIEAVDKCSRGVYDIITLDLEMPRMTGVQALPLIRKNQPNVPIVVLTGYANETGAASLNDVARILLKPMSLRELEDVVRELLPAR